MKKNEIQKRLVHLIENGYSQNRLAKKLGVSPATLSFVLNSKWESVSDEMLLKISSQLKAQSWVIVQTSNFNSVRKVCKYAQSQSEMVGIVGFTGAGKTTALSKYIGKNTFMVTCKKTMRAKHFYSKILQEMGIDYSGTIYDIVERISAEMNKRQSPLLIIDEAGKLNHTILLYLHDLRDSTKCGIVLAGVEYFKGNLKKAADKQKEGMPEFYDRVSSWVQLQPPTKSEKEAICKANGLTDLQAVKEIVRVNNFRKLANAIKTRLVNETV